MCRTTYHQRVVDDSCRQVVSVFSLQWTNYAADTCNYRLTFCSSFPPPLFLLLWAWESTQSNGQLKCRCVQQSCECEVRWTLVAAIAQSHCNWREDKRRSLSLSLSVSFCHSPSLLNWIIDLGKFIFLQMLQECECDCFVLLLQYCSCCCRTKMYVRMHPSSLWRCWTAIKYTFHFKTFIYLPLPLPPLSFSFSPLLVLCQCVEWLPHLMDSRVMFTGVHSWVLCLLMVK